MTELEAAIARAEAAEARFIEQRDSLVSVTKKLAQTEARLAEEQRISTLRRSRIELDLIPSLSDAHAAIPRAYKMGLDAASAHCEKLALGWKDEAGLHVYPSAAYCAVTIRALTPPADLVQQATKGTDHE